MYDKMTGLILRSSSSSSTNAAKATANLLQRYHRNQRYYSQYARSGHGYVSVQRQQKQQFHSDSISLLVAPSKTATFTPTTFASRNSTRQVQVASHNLRSPTAIAASTKTTASTSKRFTSSTTNSSPPDDPTMKNVVLAAGLFGFVASVFFYSLNAVGRGEENLDGELDPLATLKAEAQEARESGKYNQAQQGRMTEEEIHELETGRSIGGDDAEILEAALEEEANRKVFGDGGSDDASSSKKQTKKKPWWRFGF